MTLSMGCQGQANRVSTVLHRSSRHALAARGNHKLYVLTTCPTPMPFLALKISKTPLNQSYVSRGRGWL
eukprot:46102-Pyramimonas_sp.AAC.1